MRLLAISDVTCDYMGSIDFMRHFTTIEKPFFIYQPETDNIIHDVDSTVDGILYNSIENMPTQLPSNASAHFGSKLYPFMERILKSDVSKPLKEQGLPEEIEKAVITHNGKLANLFSYISKLREQKKKEKLKPELIKDINLMRKNSYFSDDKSRIKVFKIKGHLFDKNIINHVMDYLVGK